MADPTSRVARFRILMPVEPGGVSRVAKGADCKSAASWLRRFESFLPHQQIQQLKRFTRGHAVLEVSRVTLRVTKAELPRFCAAAGLCSRFLPRFRFANSRRNH